MIRATSNSCDEIDENKTGSRMVGCVPVSELSCVYQPIVDLQTGKPFAYELLARCKVYDDFRHVETHTHSALLGEVEANSRRVRGNLKAVEIHLALS